MDSSPFPPPPYENPPSYDQPPSDPFSPTNISACVQATIQDAVATELVTPETKTQFMHEVKALAEIVLRVNADFDRVRRGLIKPDDYGNISSNDFQSTWDDQHRRWTELVWRSRDAATTAEAYIKDFLEVIVPEVEAIQNDEDLADAKLDLEAFIKRPDPSGTIQTLQKHSQDFCDLPDPANQLPEYITSKKHEIGRLTPQIQQCTTSPMGISSLPLTVGGVVLPITIGGIVLPLAVSGRAVLGQENVTPHEHTSIFSSLAACIALAPNVAIGVVITAAIAAVTKISSLIIQKKQEKDRDEAKRVLGSITGLIEHLQKTKVVLDSQKPNMNNICYRLNAFPKIWQIVRQDAQQIQDGLSDAIGDDRLKNDFKRRVGLIKKSYSNLDEALSFYATRVNNFART